MPIAARVIDVPRLPAGIARFNMTTQRSGATGKNRPPRFGFGYGERVRGKIRRTMTTQHGGQIGLRLHKSEPTKPT